MLNRSLCSGSEEPRDRHPAEEDRRGAEPGRADPVPEEVLRALQPRWVRSGLSDGTKRFQKEEDDDIKTSADSVFFSLCNSQRDEAVLHSVQHVGRQEGLSGEGGQ